MGPHPDYVTGMQVYKKIEDYKGSAPVVLSIGNFDGLHRGHQHLLQQNLDLSAKWGARSVVLSFFPHPMSIFKPTEFIPLSDLLDQEAGLETLGIDDWIIEPFGPSLRTETAEDFFQRLRQSLNIKAIVVGADFRFGRDRLGDGPFLKEKGSRHGFELVVPETYFYREHRVSSTLIRQMLHQGDVVSAGELLSRPYALRGIVETGFRRGRQLGYPTANVTNTRAGNLKRGVYATTVLLRGTRWKGATNVGLHPTFGEETQIKIETHILDFSENIYGEELKIEFNHFIRPEMKFSGVDSLKQQIEKDLQIVRTYQ